MDYTRLKVCNDISWTNTDDMIFVFSEKEKKMYLLKGIKRDLWINIIQKYNFGIFLDKLNLIEINENEIDEEEIKQSLQYLIKEKLIEFEE